MKMPFWIALLWCGCLLGPEGRAASRAFSNPEEPRMLIVEAFNGSVVVEGSDFDEVEATIGPEFSSFLNRSGSRLLRDSVATSPVGREVSIVEENNRMTIRFRSKGVDQTLKVRVPGNVNLKLLVRGSGAAGVNGVVGEIEVECLQGGIYLDRIQGPVIAHALNEDVVAKFAKVVPGNPNFLSSLNGDIELVVPEETDASFQLEYFNGEVESTIPLTLLPGSDLWTSGEVGTFEPSRVAETQRRAIHFRIKNHNGNIIIRDYPKEEANEE